MRELKFEFVLKNEETNDIVTVDYTLDEIMENNIDELYILEQLEENYEKPYCSCFNEGQNFCECDPFFENYQIIARRQYTGKKDKNGKELCEGDIIKVIYNNGASEIGIIEYNIDAIRFWYRLKNNEFYGIIGENDIEKIGNIYENLELKRHNRSKT